MATRIANIFAQRAVQTVCANFVIRCEVEGHQGSAKSSIKCASRVG